MSKRQHFFGERKCLLHVRIPKGNLPAQLCRRWRHHQLCGVPHFKLRAFLERSRKKKKKQIKFWWRLILKKRPTLKPLLSPVQSYTCSTGWEKQEDERQRGFLTQVSQHSAHIFTSCLQLSGCVLFCFTSLRRSLSVTAQVGRNMVFCSEISFCHPTASQYQPDITSSLMSAFIYSSLPRHTAHILANHPSFSISV